MKSIVFLSSLLILSSCVTPIPPEEVYYGATIRSDLSDKALYEATLEWMSVTLPNWANYDDQMLMADSLFAGATGVSPTALNTATSLGVAYESEDSYRLRGVGQVDVYYAIMSYPVRFNLLAQISNGMVDFTFDNMVIARRGGSIINDKDMFLKTLVELDEIVLHFEKFLESM